MELRNIKVGRDTTARIYSRSFLSQSVARRAIAARREIAFRVHSNVELWKLLDKSRSVSREKARAPVVTFLKRGNEPRRGDDDIFRSRVR